MGYNSYSYKQHTQKCLNMAFNGTPIAVIDLETTGRSAAKNYVFEFAGIKILIDKNLNVKVIDKLSGLMNPAEPLSDKITEITGFTNEDVKDKPSESVFFPQIKKFMEGTIMCAHNAVFENGFMTAMYERNNDIFLPFEILDTLKMSRDLHKEEKSHKLSDIAARYGVDAGIRFHDARGDTIVCAKILSRFINEYSDLKEDSQDGKLIPTVYSVRYWEGKRYDQKRLYIATDCGTVWWSVFNRIWGEKDKGTIDAVNMKYLEQRVLSITNCQNLDELAKYRG